MIFYTSSLLSKWGFKDGDIFDDILYDNFITMPEVTAEPHDREHQALIHIVKEFILPKLDQKVEVVEICTIHNPIRAKTVDGVNVEDQWYDVNHTTKITPEIIVVPDEIVFKILCEFANKPVTPNQNES